ncbi:MAG: N-acetylglucosamine-6-phosphate deacetylase [Lachnospiraceae bacterium]|jgi:N-acetylglucosamine-6-phosphate deacetylase|nr:N-acetylglucosamine-6-phosphate deacetylase [Lachnospiraceae bacterium]
MLIQSKKIWIADQFMAAELDIRDGKIVDVLPYGSRSADVDYGDLRIVPGFLDIHCHGAYGFDTNDANEEGLRNWTKHVVDEGVTGLLATTITQSEEVLTKAVANVAKVMEDGYEGAEILGIHFEGPYLDMVYKGAQPEQHIVKPTIEQFKRYQEAAKGNIRYITMATETDDDFALTHYLTEHGVTVSIGHSAATYEQAAMAFAHGARSMTHVYNGMTPFNHRANGLVGAAYRFRTMYGEIICDGNHSTTAALNNYFMSKGPDYSIMISDALMAKGSPAGTRYIFGGNEIEIYPDGSAHLTSTGGLAGSTLRLNEGLRILVEEALVPFNYAINSCTINPARCIGIDNRKGLIGVGMDADLVVLEHNYQVRQTYCMGKAQLP